MNADITSVEAKQV